jgi:hypothetical protein
VQTLNDPHGCQVTETIEGSIDGVSVTVRDGITLLIFREAGTETRAGTSFDGSAYVDIGSTSSSIRGGLAGLGNCNAFVEVRSADGKLIALNFERSESGTFVDNTYTCTNTGRLEIP